MLVLPLFLGTPQLGLWEIALCFHGNELLHIEYVRSVLKKPLLMSNHEQLWRFFFDDTKISIECDPAKCVVFVSKTGPMCTLSHKAHTNLESGLSRGSVLSACQCPTSFVLYRRPGRKKLAFAHFC